MRDPVRRLCGPAFLVALSLTATTAEACRCAPRPPAARARAADAIVVADVIRIDDRDPAARRYALRVVRSRKTRLAGPVVVRSAATTCRAEFTAGQRYLVYLKRAGADYRTDACAGNRPAADAAPTITALGRATGTR